MRLASGNSVTTGANLFREPKYISSKLKMAEPQAPKMGKEKGSGLRYGQMDVETANVLGITLNTLYTTWSRRFFWGDFSYITEKGP